MLNKVSSILWGNVILQYFDDVKDIMKLRLINLIVKSVIDEALSIYHGTLICEIEGIYCNIHQLRTDYEVLFHEFDKLIQAESFLDSIPYIPIRMYKSSLESTVLQVICMLLHENQSKYTKKSLIFSRDTVNTLLKHIPDDELLETIQLDTPISTLKHRLNPSSRTHSSSHSVLKWIIIYIDLVQEIRLAPDAYKFTVSFRSRLRVLTVLRRQLDEFYIRSLNDLLRI